MFRLLFRDGFKLKLPLHEFMFWEVTQSGKKHTERHAALMMVPMPAPITALSIWPVLITSETADRTLLFDWHRDKLTFQHNSDNSSLASPQIMEQPSGVMSCIYNGNVLLKPSDWAEDWKRSHEMRMWAHRFLLFRVFSFHSPINDRMSWSYEIIMALLTFMTFLSPVSDLKQLTLIHLYFHNSSHSIALPLFPFSFGDELF